MTPQEARLLNPDYTRRSPIGSAAAASGTRLTRTKPSHGVLLARYIEGWTTADAGTIRSATARSYRFVDPLIGDFSRWSLDGYFERLGAAFRVTASGRLSAIRINLVGPMSETKINGEYVFWREVPDLGLTGVASLVVGSKGVIAERVCYDLNLAIEILRREMGSRLRVTSESVSGQNGKASFEN